MNARGSFSDFTTRYASQLGPLTFHKDENAADVLADLCAEVRNGRLPPIYLIIDEYDNFTNQLVTTHQDALYREITTGDSFFRTFFKVIKAGIEDRSIGRVFITGVLPITIDDLTSGFNIAQIVTLKRPFLQLLGFTQAEVDRYLDTIFAEYGFPTEIKSQVFSVVKDFYNGYAFDPDIEERLYNSTVINYFLEQFVNEGGSIPRDVIDENLRTDVSWIKRLAGSEGPAVSILERILVENELPYDEEMLRSKFNMEQFFEREFYPVSLFYLGMLTIKDRFRHDAAQPDHAKNLR